MIRSLVAAILFDTSFRYRPSFDTDNAGRIISRDELLSKVWKCQQTMTTRTVDQTISSLRRKLGDDAESPRYLITAYGVGYTLGTFTSYAPESRKTARALR